MFFFISSFNILIWAFLKVWPKASQSKEEKAVWKKRQIKLQKRESKMES